MRSLCASVEFLVDIGKALLGEIFLLVVKSAKFDSCCSYSGGSRFRVLFTLSFKSVEGRKSQEELCYGLGSGCGNGLLKFFRCGR